MGWNDAIKVPAQCQAYYGDACAALHANKVQGLADGPKIICDWDSDV